MLAAPEVLLARPLPHLVPVLDRRPTLRVLIASLARGGAERIVLEWLEAEARTARNVELAILHPRRNAWRAPPGVRAIENGARSSEAFVASLAERWQRSPEPISTHLVSDDLLEILWSAGIATIPTVHNTRQGWRNDPARWVGPHVPHAIACAEAVRQELLAAGCAVPVYTIRHVPAPARAATDPTQREAVRRAWGIDREALLVGAVGAFKPQKDFPRAVEVLGALRRSREAFLVILGGVLERAHVGELERTLDRVTALDLADHVKLPGFVDPIAPWYAACDVLLAVSRYEGFSMATREALASGLPVVGLDVGGQAEAPHERLTLLAANASTRSIAARVAGFPVRQELPQPATPARAPRIWSVAHSGRAPQRAPIDTLFVTANLNAGGAQRSLLNLASALRVRHRIAVAVCGETTQRAFAEGLAEAGVDCFRAAASPDPFTLAESLLAEAGSSGARTLCFWNVDPRVKLLIGKFAAPSLRLVDAIPGAYAFEEMERERTFAAAITYTPEAWFERLNVLVVKHAGEHRPPCKEVRVIPNGVAFRTARAIAPALPRFLVSGRIAPSKRLETILEAFARLAAGYPGAELHIVGQAEPRDARYAARVTAAAEGLGVRFRGPMPRLEHLDEPFTATIVLGTHQGSPNAVLEAMAAGIPVIANASGGTRELVRDGATGWLLSEPAPAAELVSAMQECLRRPELGRRFAAEARAHVRASFSLEAMASRYLDCFDVKAGSHESPQPPRG